MGEKIKFGPCCCCGQRPGTQIVSLPFYAPVPGTGWGCYICGLPQDGAVAVVCDACMQEEREIRYAVVGRAWQDRRIEIMDLVPGFEHKGGVDHGSGR